MGQGRIAAVILVLVLLVDQVVKYLVKTGMYLGQSIEILPWFKLVFVENNGMAFGMEFFGKLFLSLFRIVFIGLLFAYLMKIRNKGFPNGYFVTVSFILAGALGNLIDCLFYGMVFSKSTYAIDGVAQFAGFGNGYSGFLYGKVVDMFYFPLWTWPDWMPLVGGNIFFGPVFNVADACISCGMIVILLFYSRYVNMGLHFQEKDNTDEK